MLAGWGGARLLRSDLFPLFTVVNLSTAAFLRYHPLFGDKAKRLLEF